MIKHYHILLIGFVSSVFAGSYLSSKDKNCRSECKTDDHCQLGYVCERVDCKFVCVRKVIPLHPVVDPLVPKDNNGEIITRGDIPVRGGSIILKDGTILSSAKVDNSPFDPVSALESTRIKETHSADKLFICINKCLASTSCMKGQDCVGCEKQCQQEHALINVDPFFPPKALDRPMPPMLNDIGPIIADKSVVQNKIPVDSTSGFQADYTGVLPHDGKVDTGFVHENIPVVPVSPIDSYGSKDVGQNNMISGSGIFDDRFVGVDSTGQLIDTLNVPMGHDSIIPVNPVPPVKPIDNKSYGSKIVKGQNQVKIDDQHLDVNPVVIVDSSGQIIDISGSGFPSGHNQNNAHINSITPVKPIESYGQKEIVSLDDNFNGNPSIVVDSSGQIIDVSGSGPVGPTQPVFSPVKPIDTYGSKMLKENQRVISLDKPVGPSLVTDYMGQIVDTSFSGFPTRHRQNVPVNTITPVKPIESYGQKEVVSLDDNFNGNPSVVVDSSGQIIDASGSALPLGHTPPVRPLTPVKPIDTYGSTVFKGEQRIIPLHEPVGPSVVKDYTGKIVDTSFSGLFTGYKQNVPVNPIAPVKHIDSYGQKEIVSLDDNFNGNPSVVVDSSGQIIDASGSGLPLGHSRPVRPLTPVKPIDAYGSTVLKGEKRTILLDEPVNPSVVIDSNGQIVDTFSSEYPVAHNQNVPVHPNTPMKPVDSYGQKEIVSFDDHFNGNPSVVVDSSGQIIDASGSGLLLEGRPLSPVKPINAYGSKVFKGEKQTLSLDIPVNPSVVIDSNGQIVDTFSSGLPYKDSQNVPVYPKTPVKPIDSYGQKQIVVDDHLNTNPFVGVDATGHITDTSILSVGHNTINQGKLLTSIKPIDSYVPNDIPGPKEILTIDGHAKENPSVIVDANGQKVSVLDKIVTETMPGGQIDRLLPVNPMESYGSGKLSGHNNILVKGSFPVDSTGSYIPESRASVLGKSMKTNSDELSLCINNCLASTTCLVGQNCAGNCKKMCQKELSGAVVVPKLSEETMILQKGTTINDKTVLVDINGEVKPIHPGSEIVNTEIVSGNPTLTIGSVDVMVPGRQDCFKECNRDIHCGLHKVCVEKGCKRVCVARPTVRDSLDNGYAPKKL